MARLNPVGATNEGERQIRELLRRNTCGALAKRLRCDEKSIRNYARGRRSPHPVMRMKMRAELGIPEGAWDEPASKDVYVVEPATAKAPPP